MEIRKDVVKFRFITDNPTTEELVPFLPAIKSSRLDVYKYYDSEDEPEVTFKDIIRRIDNCLDYFETEQDKISGAVYNGNGYLGGRLIVDAHQQKRLRINLERIDKQLNALNALRDYLIDDTTHSHYIVNGFLDNLFMYSSSFEAHPIQIVEFNVYKPVFNNDTMLWEAVPTTMRGITTEQMSTICCIEDWVSLDDYDCLYRVNAEWRFATTADKILKYNTHPDFVYKKCKDCGKVYALDETEKEWFEHHDMRPPVRCETCRKKRREGSERKS